jgi:hypothetical protein
VIQGQQYFDRDMRLRYPDDECRVSNDSTYRSVFWGCGHEFKVLARSPWNLQLALWRLFCAREPTIPGNHQLLYQNQRTFIRQNKNLFSDYFFQVRNSFEDYLGGCLEALIHHADKHDKVALRVAAWEDLAQLGLQGIIDHPWTLVPELKMKLEEYAKPNKRGRIICDLGPMAALAGIMFAETMKAGMAQAPYVTPDRDCEVRFVKSPKQAALRSAFKFLIDCPRRVCAIVFSDDICIAIRRGHTILRYNIDISNCDNSHTLDLFTLLQDMVPPQFAPDVSRLIQQCRVRMKILHPLYPFDKTKRIVIEPLGCQLRSGSTITTLINVLASTLIVVAIHNANACTPEEVRVAARAAGYIITVETCEVWHQYQFLKHSPVLDVNGEVQALLNFGVLLRASGTCKGDLPGRGDVLRRAVKHQRSLINAAYPMARTSLRRAMMSSVGDGSVYSVSDFKHKVARDPDDVVFHVSDYEAYKRYQMPMGLVDEMLYLLSKQTFGDEVACPAIDRILRVDYGAGLQVGNTASIPPLNHRFR